MGIMDSIRTRFGQKILGSDESIIRNSIYLGKYVKEESETKFLWIVKSESYYCQIFHRGERD